MTNFIKQLIVNHGLVTGATAAQVDSASMTSTGVTAGSYTSTNLTVDAAGRITAASNGSAGTTTYAGGVNNQTGTSYTFVDGDNGKLVTFSNASAIAATLPQAGSSSHFNSTWYIAVENRGSGTLTITPTTSTIDGAASLAITTNQGCVIYSDGSNYFTERGITQTGTIPSNVVAMSSNYAIAATSTWYDTGFTLSLPGAGTYLLFANVRAAANVTYSGSVNTSGFSIQAKLYESAAGADVTNTTTIILRGDSTIESGGLWDRDAPIFGVLTTVQSSPVVHLYAERLVSGVAPTWNTSNIVSDSQGLTVMGYVQLSGVSGGGGPGGAAGGDLSGTYPNPTVAKMQGVAISSSAPTSGYLLGYNGTQWAPTNEIDSFYGALHSDTDGSTITFDLSVSNKHTVTLGGNRTLAVTNGNNGQCFMIELVQDGTGSRTVTWFNTIKWAGGTAPTLTTTANKTDCFGFMQTSSGQYQGFVIGQNI